MLSELDSYEIEKAKVNQNQPLKSYSVDIDGGRVEIIPDPYLVNVYGLDYAIQDKINHTRFVGIF